MNYRDFVCFVRNGVRKELGEGVQVLIRQITKNNSVVRDGLLISEKGCPLAPAIYLNDFYEEYMDGLSIPEIVDCVVKIYRKSRITAPFDAAFYADYEKVRPRLACRLINQRSNEELLEFVPHRCFLDLAVVVYYHFEDSQLGGGSILVYRKHLKNWGITEKELFRVARENTLRLTPEEFMPMSAVLKRFCQDKALQEEPPRKEEPQEETSQEKAPHEKAPQEEPQRKEWPQEEASQEKAPHEKALQEEPQCKETPGVEEGAKKAWEKEAAEDGQPEEKKEAEQMYVLTNRDARFGAVCIMYDEVLQKVAGRLGEDFWILPSSIHECIIVPFSIPMEQGRLQEMVRQINLEEVSAEEYLSDEVYLYQAKLHRLSM